MDIFDLYAKITLDSKGYTTGIDEASAKFNSFKAGLGSALASIAKITAAAVTAGAAATAKIVKDAVANYGEYEQLVGGIETLFKESAGTVQANAEKAFATAQISANQYMDLVTSFSASLIQSTGRGIQTNLSDLKESQKEQLKATKQTYADELKAEKARWDAKIKLADKSQKESLRNQKDAAIDSLKKQQSERLILLEKSNKKALEDAENANSQSTTSAQSLERAAKLSDLAVIDMADNANKMGTNMQSIQNAYQGFAKANYTMLDNLKLGYGGTKSEMERLLKDADALNAKQGKVTKYSIDSFADIVEAIHVVQQNLGITGTSAEEAGTTIQGSMASVKAAWQDVLTAMGSGKDLDKKLDNFTQSVKKYAENMLPIVRQALKGAVKAIGQLAPQIAKELPKLVTELAPDVVKAGADIVTNLASGIYNQLAESNFDEQAKALTEKLNDMIDGIDAKAGGEQFANIINKVINTAFNIVTTFDAENAAKKLTDWFNSAVNKTDWNKLGQTVGNLWKGVWDFIGKALDNIDWVGVGDAISEFVNGIDWWGIIDSLFKVIGTVIKNAPDLLWSVVKNLDFDNAAGMFALFFAPKMADNLLSFFKTNAGTKSTLTQAGTTMGDQVGGGFTGQGGSMATGLVGKISGGLKTATTIASAFAIGWELGTLIKKGLDAIGWGQWIDDKINSLMEVVTAAERAKATENDIKAQNLEQLTKFKKLGFTHLTEQDIEIGSQAYIKAYNIAGLLAKYPELSKAGYTATRILNDVSLYEDLMAGKLPTKVQEMVRGYIPTTSDLIAQSNYRTAYQEASASMGYAPTSVINQNAQIYLDTGKLVGGTGNTRAQQTNYTARGYAT